MSVSGSFQLSKMSTRPFRMPPFKFGKISAVWFSILFVWCQCRNCCFCLHVRLFGNENGKIYIFKYRNYRFSESYHELSDCWWTAMFCSIGQLYECLITCKSSPRFRWSQKQLQPRHPLLYHSVIDLIMLTVGRIQFKFFLPLTTKCAHNQTTNIWMYSLCVIKKSPVIIFRSSPRIS